jgi:hypothetical protein
MVKRRNTMVYVSGGADFTHVAPQAEQDGWQGLLRSPQMQEKAIEYLEMNGIPVTPYTMNQVTLMEHQQLQASISRWQGASTDDMRNAIKQGDVGAAIALREKMPSGGGFFGDLMAKATDNWIKDNSPAVASAIGLT